VIGTVLRIRYELTQLQSENPIFKTFAAIDKLQGREVSVRIIRDAYASDPELIELLSTVIRKLSAARHPGIEELYELDSDEGTTFVVGQLSRGATLSERLRKLATFSVPAAVEAAIGISDALQALHRSGMAHGDVGGHSILLLPDGEVRLQNAGLWEAYAGSQTAQDAMLAIMAPYMAPEISRGGLPTPASDVYSLGILLFELLTGRQPFRADNAIGMAVRHATDPVPNAKGLNPSIPQTLDYIVQKAMSKSTATRYADAGEILSDLRMLQDALRFGKSLSWPIRKEEAPEPEPQPTMTPKAVAASPKPKPVPTAREPREEGDVPVWLKVPIAFVAGILVVMVVYFLVLNFSKSKSVHVPELKRLTASEAMAHLKSLGLVMQRKGSEASEQVPAESVIRTDPPAGATVYQGSAVGVVVSSGSRFVEVPDVRGVTVDKARTLLSSVGLQLDDRVEQVHDNNVESGMIVSQVPPPRESHERQTRVHVRVSSGRGASSGERDPNANSKYVYSVKIKLTDIDKPVLLRVDMTDNRGTKTVHESRHNPADEINVSAEGYGSDVSFRIFYDGDLVKQVAASPDQTNQNSDEQP
jgi:hypothetical protein